MIATVAGSLGHPGRHNSGRYDPRRHRLCDFLARTWRGWLAGLGVFRGYSSATIQGTPPSFFRTTLTAAILDLDTTRSRTWAGRDKDVKLSRWAFSMNASTRVATALIS